MNIPRELWPNRQSSLEQAKCLHRYREIKIKRAKEPQSVFAHRGHEFHRLHQEYVDYLVKSEQEMDWTMARDLAESSGNQEARELFVAWAERSIIDYRTVYGTEVKLRLDENFQPTETDVCFSGDLDRLEIHGTRAVAWDAKSHFKAFDPDTIQADMYVFLISKVLPHIEQIDFTLEFIRFGITRTKTYMKPDIAEAEKEIMRHVSRLIEAYEKNDWPATPCSQCSYCSLECPLIVSGMSRESVGQIESPDRATRLAGELYVMEMRAKRMKEQLKGYVTEFGPISMDHGQALGFQKRESQIYEVQHVRALNEEHGFDRNRCLTVDNQEVKRVAKKYPEYKSRLQGTKKDSSTTIFGFRNEEED